METFIKTLGDVWCLLAHERKWDRATVRTNFYCRCRRCQRLWPGGEDAQLTSEPMERLERWLPGAFIKGGPPHGARNWLRRHIWR